MTPLSFTLLIAALGAAPEATPLPDVAAEKTATPAPVTPAPVTPAPEATAPVTPAPEAIAPTPTAKPPAPDAIAADAESIRRFALHLLANGDAYRAIGELKRYLFLMPDAPDAAAVELTIGEAYLAGDRPIEAALHFERLADKATQPTERARLRLRSGLAAYAADEWAQAARTLSIALPRLEQPERDQARLVGGLALAGLNQDRAAAVMLDGIESAALEPLAHAAAYEIANRDALLAYRSPFLAGTLSAIVPGAGHAYVGELGVGLAALVANGLLVWGTAESVRAELWGVAAVTGTVEALFYFGALTGAVSAAHRFNRDARLNHHDDLRRRLLPDPQLLP